MLTEDSLLHKWKRNRHQASKSRARHLQNPSVSQNYSKKEVWRSRWELHTPVCLNQDMSLISFGMCPGWRIGSVLIRFYSKSTLNENLSSVQYRGEDNAYRQWFGLENSSGWRHPVGKRRDTDGTCNIESKLGALEKRNSHAAFVDWVPPMPKAMGCSCVFIHPAE